MALCQLYNNVLSFTSLTAHWDQTHLGTLGPPVFRMFGCLYHRLGALIPAVNQRPAFVQTWLIDPAKATNTRLGPDGADSCMQQSTLSRISASESRQFNMLERSVNYCNDTVNTTDLI
ncbi:BQ5605_C018g08771 [Microbotryum silenes-dioicae]|uniref:BQ5605_C018g08771 protein n=1 Tax=Microbotryum silenes-dioicae TaxID=796604 RepID=A0A2X0NUS6_9BASI|nr:BQ5605_C018g08771 [Microbotryum silenes-dioicae]